MTISLKITAQQKANISNLNTSTLFKCVMRLKSPKQLLDLEDKKSLELEQLVYGSKQKKAASHSLLDEAYEMQKTVNSQKISNLLEMVTDAEVTIERIDVPVFDNYNKKVENITAVIEEHTEKLINTNSNIEEIESNIDINAVQLYAITEKVENIINNNLVGTHNKIEEVRLMQELIHKKLKSIPNEESRFNPHSIYESIKALKTSLGNNITQTSDELNAKIDAIEEIRSYDDDLEKLQDLIGSVRSSIKYYDSDVAELQGEIKGLSETLTETIGKKVKALSSKIDRKALGIKNDIKKDIKYYDEEIADVEYRIDRIVESVQALPPIKHYDSEIKDLNNLIEKLDNKIEAINTEAIQDTVQILEQNFLEMNKHQKDFENRWKKEAEKNKKKKDQVINTDKFVTFDQMQQHYRGFIERVTEQLGSLGGGGSVRIMDMDDLDEDIRQNPQNYDGEFLQIQYDSEKNITTIGAAPDIVNDLDDLDDVDTSGAADGMVLVYIEATGKWEARVVQYIGVNIDANPDPEIQDYGGYS